MAGWLDGLKKRTIPDVLPALGLQRGRMRSVGPCPLCGAEKRSAGDRRLAMGLNRNARGLKCHVCDESLDIVDLCAVKIAGSRFKELGEEGRARLREEFAARGWTDRSRGAGPRSSHVSAHLGEAGRAAGKRTARRAKSGQGFAWNSKDLALGPDRLKSEDGARALQYLRARGFSDTTIEAWGLGAHFIRKDGEIREEYISIPMKDSTGKIVNCRFRSVDGPCLYCCPDPATAERGKGCDRCKDRGGEMTGRVQKRYRPCTGRPLPLFGSHLLVEDRTCPVLVLEGELDVIAAWEYGLQGNVVTGTAGAATFKEEWLDQLEPYQSFLLGMDDDEPGNDGSEKLATKLGRYRCSRLRFPENDLGECLRTGIPRERINLAMVNASPMVASTFRKADHYIDPLEDLIENPDRLRGIPTPSRRLNDKLAGLRPGLTVVTGDTGCGKTTFSTWIGWSLAKMGVGVMVTSYEQKPIGTVQKLLRMEMKGDFTKGTKEERRASLVELAGRPLWLLDIYGHQGFQAAIDAVRYSIRRHGCRWFLIDHLGFLIPEDEQDERRATDKVIRALAILANTEEVMIWLICHPSNAYVSQRRRPMLTDLKGASAIRQDASDGLVLVPQKVTKKSPYCSTKIFLDKVRSEFGKSGTEVVLPFDPVALHYADAPEGLPTLQRGDVTVDPASCAPNRKRGAQG